MVNFSLEGKVALVTGALTELASLWQLPMHKPVQNRVQRHQTRISGQRSGCLQS